MQLPSLISFCNPLSKKKERSFKVLLIFMCPEVHRTSLHNSLGSLNIFHFIANLWIQQTKTAKSYLLAISIGPNTNISACYLVIMPNKCILY